MNKKRSLSSVLRLLLVFSLTLAMVLSGLLLKTRPAKTHGFPIIDGRFTGDWCAPAAKGLFGPDSFTSLAPPGCVLGTEFLWDDFDLVTYGAGAATDTIGYRSAGAPDPEIDINFFATTADAANVYFAIALGMFPSGIGSPPHVQIAIDLNGAVGVPVGWYDPPIPPPAGGTGAVGMAAVPAPIFPDYLITSDVLAGVAYLWESTTVPGTWTLIGPVPLGWSGIIGPGPGVIEIAVPWGLFTPGPPFVPGVSVKMTIMSAHSRPSPLGPSGAPMTPEDDVFTSHAPGVGPGFTTSPDLCPPAPGSSACELIIPGPGGGVGSADAFVTLIYPIPTATPTPTATSILTLTVTATPTTTAVPSLTPTPTITPTPTATDANTPTATATRSATLSPTFTPTSTSTPDPSRTLYLPIIRK